MVSLGSSRKKKEKERDIKLKKGKNSGRNLGKKTIAGESKHTHCALEKFPEKGKS